MFALSLLLACSSDEVERPEPTTTDTSTTDTTPTVDTDTTTDSGTPPTTTPTETAVPITWDCANLPIGPVSVTELDRPRGYHGLVFDALGNIVGSDGANLIAVDSAGTFSIFAPGVGAGQQIEVLPDGDFVMATDNGALSRISQSGVASVMVGDVGAYGVVVGDDGMVYAADYQRVIRVDPTTLDREIVFDGQGASVKVIGFAPDNSRMYVGTIGGDIYAQDLVNFEPSGDPIVFAKGVGGWHDCLVVDACGNLLVCDYTNRRLYRVDPTGKVGQFYDWPSDLYGHGATFGTGADGWREDALYLPQPYDSNTVVELVLGVPSRKYAP